MPGAGSTAQSRSRAPDDLSSPAAPHTTSRDAWAEYGSVITYFVAVAVGLVWCFVYWRFTKVFPDGKFGGSAYRYRDDALITLSHARGWSDVGTISVGTSGSRVEAFSSPLQFLIAAVFFRFGGNNPNTFIDWQIPCATFLLGVSVFGICRLAAPQRSRIDAAVVAGLASLAVFTIYPVFAWHSSGMENPLTNALAVAAVAGSAWAVERQRGLWAAGLLIALFGLVRVEFVVYGVTVLIVSAVALWMRSHSWERVGAFVGPAALLWLLVHGYRYRYFGSLEPNSGRQQGIDVGAALQTWFGVLWPLLLIPVGAIVIMVRQHRPFGRVVRSWPFWIVVAVCVQTACFLAIRHDHHTPLPGLEALGDAARVLGIWWWLVVAGALSILLVWQNVARLVHVLLAAVILVGLAHVPMFGGARLAVERVITFLMVVIVAFVGASIVAVDWRALVRGARADRVLLLLVAGVALFAFNGLWASRGSWNEEAGLCCDQRELTGRILAETAAFRAQTGLVNPAIANPDIGLLSFEKRGNIFDLGRLGDPLMTELWQRGVDAGDFSLLTNYLNRYAVPDVVEIHGLWSCQYADWLRSDEFAAQYRQVWDDGWSRSYTASSCPSGDTELGGGIWVRSDLSDSRGRPELALSRALSRRPTVSRVRGALRECRSSDSEAGCAYVGRSVYRNLRAFADAGTLGEVRSLFDRDDEAFERAVLSSRSRGRWYLDAADALASARSRPR